MASMGGEPGGSFLTAWRGLADNPLPRLWALAAQRSAARSRWYASPLFWGSALVSALVTFLLVLNLLDFLGWRESVIATRGFCLARLGYALAQIALGGMLAAALWLLTRVHALASLSLGLLSGDRTNPAALDGLLGLSALSRREIMAALAYQALRLLWPPLAALNLCELGACLLLIASAGQFHSAPGEAWLKLAAIAGAGLGYFLLALASGVCLAFYLLIAGRGLRSPVAAELGASLAVLACGLSLLLGPLAQPAGGRLAVASYQDVYLAAWLTCFGLAVLLSYLAILALEWRPARYLLLACLPLYVAVMEPVTRHYPGNSAAPFVINQGEMAFLQLANVLPPAPLQQVLPLIFEVYDTLPYWSIRSPFAYVSLSVGFHADVPSELGKAAGLGLALFAGRLLEACGLAALALFALASWRRELGGTGEADAARRGNAGAPSGAGRRALSAAFACLAVPPLAALLVLAGVALLHHPPPVRTGDALLDAWLTLELEHNAIVRQYHITAYAQLTLAGTVLSERDWGSLQARFGGDPRFYLLRYRLQPFDGRTFFSRTTGAVLDLPVMYLEEARRRGIADASVLFNLLQEYEQAWSALVMGSVPELRQPSAYESRRAFEKRMREEIRARFARQEDALVAELLKAGGDQAAVHHYLARLAFQNGEDSRALGEIRLADAAARLDSLAGFPADVWARTLSRGDYVCGDKVLTVALSPELYSQLRMRSPTSNVQYLFDPLEDEMVEHLSREAYTAGDAAALKALVLLACREAGVPDGFARRTQEGSFAVRSALLNLRSGHWKTGLARQLALNELITLLPGLAPAGMAGGQLRTQRLASRSDAFRLGLWSIASGGASEYRELAAPDAASLRAFQTGVVQRAGQALKEAERFDYSRLFTAE